MRIEEINRFYYRMSVDSIFLFTKVVQQRTRCELAISLRIPICFSVVYHVKLKLIVSLES